MIIIIITVRAELVAGVWAVFVSCPLLTRQILASEGRYPVHLVPQAWTVFNTRHHRKRGLTTQGTTVLTKLTSRFVLPGRGGVVDSQTETQPSLSEAAELAETSLRSGGQH